MSFSVDIAKSVGGSRRRFELRVAFETTARRTVIYGPSGAGKSLTLQALAGLLVPDGGRILFGDETLFDAGARVHVPARVRRFGYLFQDYALFPGLNVRQNVAFGLSTGLRNPPGNAGGPAVERWLDALQLREVELQRPAELSGGQRQRVALARALVNEPRALLLDEPFSALDPELRQRTRGELDRLLTAIGIPIVMITHDPDDIEWFGEQTLYLRDGGIHDRASPPGAP
jgi:molybdate transport system ATP-binding protein